LAGGTAGPTRPYAIQTIHFQNKKARNGLHDQLNIQIGICDNELGHKKALQF